MARTKDGTLERPAPEIDERELDSSQWIELYGDYLYRYAYLHLKSKETAEDVVQDALLSAHLAIERFERKSSVKTWLVSILRNKIIDHVRKHSKAQHVSFDTVVSDPVVDESFNKMGVWSRWFSEWTMSPDTAVEHRDFLERVRGCISDLPDNLREVFLLRVMEELSTEEICEKLGITANNFWVILYRSRMRLRKCLDTKWFNVSK